jgi:hypothetical protein
MSTGWGGVAGLGGQHRRAGCGAGQAAPPSICLFRSRNNAPGWAWHAQHAQAAPGPTSESESSARASHPSSTSVSLDSRLSTADSSGPSPSASPGPAGPCAGSCCRAWRAAGPKPVAEGAEASLSLPPPPPGRCRLRLTAAAATCRLLWTVARVWGAALYGAAGGQGAGVGAHPGRVIPLSCHRMAACWQECGGVSAKCAPPSGHRERKAQCRWILLAPSIAGLLLHLHGVHDPIMLCHECVQEV